MEPAPASLSDAFGRTIDYLRISVTDRCNFRCTYCMPENARFSSRAEILAYEEIAIIAERFIARGIRRIRITGGEPLVRRDVASLFGRLGRSVRAGRLGELTLTTNGSLLSRHADMLADCGVRRVNVSLDTLDPDRFRAITRGGAVGPVVGGIDAALGAGMAVRINMVAMRGVNEEDVLPVAHFCAGRGIDLAIIETMPMGEAAHGSAGHSSAMEFLAPLLADNRVEPDDHRTAGPARYVRIEPLGLRVGLITPLSRDFCGDCNRLRLTTEGKLHPCLGHAVAYDFRAALRRDSIDGVDRLIDLALSAKPRAHDFVAQMAGVVPRVPRGMNVTGG